MKLGGPASRGARRPAAVWSRGGRRGDEGEGWWGLIGAKSSFHVAFNGKSNRVENDLQKEVNSINQILKLGVKHGTRNFEGQERNR